MKKYLQVLKITFQQDFAYRASFIMWRVRNIIQIFLLFFLWDSVFSDSSRVVFGYNREKILTYVFGILIIRAIVFSSKSTGVAGLIGKGKISILLIRPINFFKFWLTSDIASKLLNLAFAFVETLVLYFILRPPFFLQSNPFYFIAFIISLVIAVLLYFYLSMIINMAAFWMPEAGWAMQFVFLVIVQEFLSGSLFPLDIFPLFWQNIFYSLPFSYLIFFPLQVYLGKLSLATVINGLVIAGGWLIVIYFLAQRVWDKGVKKYSAEGI